MLTVLVIVMANVTYILVIVMIYAMDILAVIVIADSITLLVTVTK
mgnify:FL=1